MAYRLPPPHQPGKPHPVDVRDRTEAVVIARLIRLGYVRSYTGDEVDVFVVHCPETDRIYAVPVGDSGALKTVSLRVTAPANHQVRGIRWAADHELPA
jgi:hypothetical protein